MSLIFGYVLPLIISVLSGITEASAPECSLFKPRFGEKTCFFVTIEAKGLWFFLPIGLFLLVNAVMFTLTSMVLCQSQTNAKQVNANNPRNKKRAQFMVYVKLFLGMGFIWIFEIISGFANDGVHESAWYLTDLLNMLQGVYVFLIFVCKRSVVFAILGHKESRNKDQSVVSVLKQRLLPDRFTTVSERQQTEMMSMTPTGTNATVSEASKALA